MDIGTVIVDGNSLAHAAHNGAKLLVGEMQTQSIFSTIKSIRALLTDKYPGWNIIVLWDGKAEWRKELHPDYKSNRVAKNEEEQKKKEAYKAQSPFLRKALQLLGIRQILVTTHEADDMAGVLVRRAMGLIVLVSGDKDWLQLVRDGVVWYDPIRENQIGMGNFTDKTGYFSPREFLEGKALMGDTSDCIPGVGGIGEKGAPEFLAQFGSVENFFKQVDAGTFVPKKKAHIGLASEAGRAAFERNLRLMNLIDVPNPDRQNVSVIPPTYNEAGFQAMCEKLAFRSILRNFNEFVEPFRNAQQLRSAA